MKFIALRTNIKEAISAIEHATGGNPNLPILQNALIEASSEGISLTATNLELAIICNVSGKVIENGKVTVPLVPLANLITNIQSDRLNFNKKENSLEIKTDNYTAKLQGLPHEDFPVTPKIKNTKEYLEIKSLFIKEAIQQASIASQFSDLRPELNSLLFDFSIDNLKIAATDGFRLAEKTITQKLFQTTYQEPFKVLIPLKTTQEVARMSKDEEVIRIFKDENQILFKTDRAEIISRLSEGNFPDYSSIIPKKFITEAAVNKDEFVNAIKLASIFGQKNSEVKVSVQPGKKIIEVSSADQSLGENAYLLPAKLKGEPLEVFFNWRYLNDPLRAVKAEEIFMGFQEETNPSLIRPVNEGSYFYILKPILKS